MGYEFISLEVQEGLATITFRRPDKLNALSPLMLEEANEALAAIDRDDSVKAVALTGEGKAFSSGADLSGERDERFKPGRALKETPFGGGGQLVTSLYSLRKPSIAALNGVAAGAGMSVALACDIRIASERARLIPVFSQRALVPDLGMTYFLPRMVGIQKALDICYRGEPMEANEAFALGLVHRVVAADALMQEVRDYASRLTAGASLAIELTRRGLYRSLESDFRSCLEWEQFAQNIAVRSADFKEAAQAFFEKREPHFEGR